MNEFKTGDSVSLKGQPTILMTVGIVDGDTVQCIWLDNNKNVISEYFSYEMLMRNF